MTIRNNKDFVAGFIFFLVGIGFAYASAQYRLGTGSRMGPGYFPLLLSSLLALLGAGVMIGATGEEADSHGQIGSFNLRSLFAIVLATVLFALLIKPAGILLTVAVVSFAASYASAEGRVRIAILNAMIQMLIAFAVFYYLLGLQMPLLPPYFSF